MQLEHNDPHVAAGHLSQRRHVDRGAGLVGGNRHTAAEHRVARARHRVAEHAVGDRERIARRARASNGELARRVWIERGEGFGWINAYYRQVVVGDGEGIGVRPSVNRIGAIGGRCQGKGHALRAADDSLVLRRNRDRGGRVSGGNDHLATKHPVIIAVDGRAADRVGDKEYAVLGGVNADREGPGRFSRFRQGSCSDRRPQGLRRANRFGGSSPWRLHNRCRGEQLGFVGGN